MKIGTLKHGAMIAGLAGILRCSRNEQFGGLAWSLGPGPGGWCRRCRFGAWRCGCQCTVLRYGPYYGDGYYDYAPGPVVVDPGPTYYDYSGGPYRRPGTCRDTISGC
jgi:hypothetical protein